jgi:four helix bundle protein
MRDFKRLAVWKKAHELALATYEATAVFPQSELYGLTSQLRRAAMSIPTNIAEGCGRDGDAEFARFLRISMGSGNEVEYLLLMSRDLTFIDEATYMTLNEQVLETKRMLSGLLARLRAPGLKLEA